MNSLSSHRIREWLPWLALALFAFNFSRGLTPFVMVEGDEQGVLNGVRELARTHPDPRWMYLYPLHAGSHQIIRGLVALGVGSPEVAFGLATVVGGVASVAGAAYLAVRLVGTSWGLALLWLAAIPEMSSACFFLNSSCVAGPFAWGALALACGHGTLARTIGVGFLLGIAGWIRVDALTLAPGVLLLWWRFDRTSAIRATVIAATSSLAVLLFLWAASGIGLRDVAEIWDNRTVTRSFAEALRVASLAIGPPMLLVWLLACVRLAWRRDLWWLAFLGATCIPTLIAHGQTLTTPKYLYFVLPVFGLASLGALREYISTTGSATRIAAFALLVILALDWFTAVRSWTAERQRFKLAPPLVSLNRATIGGTTAQWVAGLGELHWTDDGYRARGGYWYAPARWHDDKVAMTRSRAALAVFASKPTPFGFVSCGWVARQAVAATLLEAGFSAGPARLHTVGDLSNYVQDWVATDGRACRQVALGVFGQSLFPQMLSELAGCRVLFVSDSTWLPKSNAGILWTALPGRDDELLLLSSANIPVTQPKS